MTRSRSLYVSVGVGWEDGASEGGAGGCCWFDVGGGVVVGFGGFLAGDCAGGSGVGFDGCAGVVCRVGGAGGFGGGGSWRMGGADG